jgi:hypothetical protein
MPASLTASFHGHGLRPQRRPAILDSQPALVRICCRLDAVTCYAKRPPAEPGGG